MLVLNATDPVHVETSASGPRHRSWIVWTWAGVFLVRCYQVMVRPHLIGSCKFFPTCSEYAVEALRTHGLWRGSILAIRRLGRCHPFSPGGLDPVPPPDTRGRVSTQPVPNPAR